MKSYVFPVELAPDEEGWRAFYPAWEHLGASTWGESKEAALKNIEEVLSLMLEELLAEGQHVPLNENVAVSTDALVTVHL